MAKRSKKKWIVRLALLAAAAALCAVGWDALRPLVMAETTPVYAQYTVEVGDIETSMSLSGAIELVESESFSASERTTVQEVYVEADIKETLERSNLGNLKVGDKVNLERSMLMNGRLDGHIVQGHVDQTAVCAEVKEADGSWYYTFEYAFDKEMARQGYMTVEKGSVCVNGVSLTVCNSQQNSFQVAIIPYTHDNTNFCQIEKGTVVNLEFDIVGKYISKMMQFK